MISESREESTVRIVEHAGLLVRCVSLKEFDSSTTRSSHDPKAHILRVRGPEADLWRTIDAGLVSKPTWVTWLARASDGQGGIPRTEVKISASALAPRSGTGSNDAASPLTRSEMARIGLCGGRCHALRVGSRSSMQGRGPRSRNATHPPDMDVRRRADLWMRPRAGRKVVAVVRPSLRSPSGPSSQ